MIVVASAKNKTSTKLIFPTLQMCSIDFATFFLELKKEKDIIIWRRIFLKKFNAYQMIRQYSSENSKKISSTWLVYLLVIYQRIFTLFRLLKNHEIRPSLHDDRIKALLKYGFLIPTPYQRKVATSQNIRLRKYFNWILFSKSHTLNKHSWKCNLYF